MTLNKHCLPCSEHEVNSTYEAIFTTLKGWLDDSTCLCWRPVYDDVNATACEELNPLLHIDQVKPAPANKNNIELVKKGDVEACYIFKSTIEVSVTLTVVTHHKCGKALDVLLRLLDTALLDLSVIEQSPIRLAFEKEPNYVSERAVVSLVFCLPRTTSKAETLYRVRLSPCHPKDEVEQGMGDPPRY